METNVGTTRQCLETTECVETLPDPFVEKPLCLTYEDLAEIEAFHQESAERPILMVGFNRRFSPLIQKMKALLSQNAAPKSFIYTINAGAIPLDHWTQDSQMGGGRIIGEACHFIDLIRFIVDKTITNYQIEFMNNSSCEN